MVIWGSVHAYLIIFDSVINVMEGPFRIRIGSFIGVVQPLLLFAAIIIVAFVSWIGTHKNAD